MLITGRWRFQSHYAMSARGYRDIFPARPAAILELPPLSHMAAGMQAVVAKKYALFTWR